MSDIHGEYEAFIKMIKKIALKDTDTLYVIGDVLDRGKHPIKTLLYIIEHQNIKLLAGNHELLAIMCLKTILNKNAAADLSYETFLYGDGNLTDAKKIERIMLYGDWMRNGGFTTLEELREQNKDSIMKIYNFLRQLKLYKKIEVNDNKFLLVHAGLSNFRADKKLSEYSIEELLCGRIDYSVKYFDKTYLVTGHTPTRIINSSDGSDKIYKNKNNICIDCACTFGGNLSCLRLDDMNEYYVRNKK